MKKTILSILLICCCFFLFGCEKECQHQYEDAITTEASCTAAGVKTFTCSLCQDSYTEEIPQIEHVWGESFVSKEPTCSEEGERSVSCTECDASKVIEQIPVIDHTFVDVVTKEATCAEDGETTPTCKCGTTKLSASIPKLQHEYTEKVTKEATYRYKGEKEFTCSFCGDKYTEAINKLSASDILSAVNDGSEYVTDALECMSDALTYRKYGKDSSGRNATANMLVKTGFAINYFKEARDLCGNHSDLTEIRSLLTKIIDTLEYVKKYDSVSNSNYYSIILDIFNEEVYQDVTEYQKQMIEIFEEFA